MGGKALDMKGSIHGKNVDKGPKAGAKKRKVPHYLKGAHPYCPSQFKILCAGKEPTDDSIEPNPYSP
jgi:hypothetical protein